MDPARNISWLRSAPTNNGEIVGMLSTSDARSSPPNKVGSIHPMVLIMGLIAMRKGYLYRTRRLESPLDRATMTYGFCSSSSRLARITRMRPQVPAVPTTTVGSHRCFIMSQSLAKLHGASW